MDENRYTDDYNTNQNYNSESQGTNYYQTSSSSFQQSQMNYQQQKPEKHKKNSSGFGKKVLIGLCCGLVFGVFAGIGFQVVDVARTRIDQAKSTISSIIENSTDDTQQASADAADAATSEDATTSDDSQAASSDIKQTLDSLTTTTQSESTVTDVTEVVKAVMPSVVSVSNTYVERGSFFGQEYSSEAVSSGSGIIVGENDTELLIVTNYHVIESSDSLSVQFVDEEQVEAQVKGTDSDKDLAVIAVQLSDIKQDTMDQISIATLGSSDDLTVGEPVIAIGNALGYGQSVTTGVVSALNRPIAVSSSDDQTTSGDTQINTFIQTDAAINPGNSGGALLNIKGEVIGINSNKIGGSSVEGMGYAIPISDAKPIIEELMQKETRLKVDEANKGVLGITGVNVESQYSEVYGIPMGVYISSVIDNSGAAAAGLVRGDIITAIDGTTVETMEELKEEMNYYEAGDTVTLTIMQGSPTGYQSKDVQVTLGKQVATQSTTQEENSDSDSNNNFSFNK